MSLLDQQVSAGPGVYFPFVGGGGGGGGGGNFSTINVSTIDIQANGDINWDGALNFQGTNGGYVNILSSIAGDNSANGIQVTGSAANGQSTIGMWIGGDGKAYLQPTTPGRSFNMPGVSLVGLSSIQVEAASVSSINNAAYPPTVQTGVTPIAANQNVTYVKGGGTATIYTINNVQAQHSYRIEFPIRVQGWNANDGLTPSYAPSVQDWIQFYPIGNVVGNPAPVFDQIQLAQVSSMQNDYQATVSGVWKTTANGSEGIVAATALSVGYSTSIEINAPAFITDLGAI